jgi:hypothetical protein
LLTLVDKSEVAVGDRLLLEQCGELAEVELHAEVGLREWAGVLREAHRRVSVPFPRALIDSAALS